MPYNGNHDNLNAAEGNAALNGDDNAPPPGEGNINVDPNQD